MILMCAWCKKIINPGKREYRPEISHGICKPCADDLKMKYGMSEILTSGDVETMEKYLDKRNV